MSDIKTYECPCGQKFASPQHKASHCKACPKYKDEVRSGRIIQSPGVSPSPTPSVMTSSSLSISSSLCSSSSSSLSSTSTEPLEKSPSPKELAAPAPRVCPKASNIKKEPSVSPIKSRLAPQQSQSPYSSFTSSSGQPQQPLSEILKAGVCSRGRTLERLDQDNYSDLHWSSRRECPLSLIPLTEIIYGGSDGSQQGFKGDELILDLESGSNLAPHSKKRRKVRASRYMASRSFVKALEESGVYGLPPNVPSWITATAPPPVRPKRYFCCICGRKGIYRCPTCGTRYCSLKCKGAHEAEKTKCKGLTSRTK